ncbi:hypothetical protein J2Z48_003065 [Croceifilum oryzae]|uniref:DUF4166 domain-containing protein n=1 Tax=Croceifilum oryzae TaxID=1553429 RepID=A0AAJ1TQ03_9BACL|nr:DUF4166 domain-containing protein [Croceifilum oryzae]MDQ0418860.1 hypothetical protein [Croceifilum oryzae]
MSIYRQMLGEEAFQSLHPMLQKRYEISKGSLYASGMMKEIKTGKWWLVPLFRFGTRCKLMFPEQGNDIPFTLANVCRVGRNGEQQIHWERIFYFHKKRRYFNALMSFDSDRKIVKDYLGEPSILYSDLLFRVGMNGDLYIQSDRQRLVCGKWEIPLPKWLQGIANVREAYIEEKDAFSIQVEVRNPLVGVIFAYEGEFRIDENK